MNKPTEAQTNQLTKPQTLTDEEIEGLDYTYDFTPKSSRLVDRHFRRVIAEAQRDDTFRETIRTLEKYVFYIDSRGYIALKPHATANWQALQEGEQGG